MLWIVVKNADWFPRVIQRNNKVLHIEEEWAAQQQIVIPIYGELDRTVQRVQVQIHRVDEQDTEHPDQPNVNQTLNRLGFLIKTAPKDTALPIRPELWDRFYRQRAPYDGV